MKLYKLLWTTHKWIGIVLALVFINTALTGLLLLVKKKYDWLQPAMQSGAAGNVSDYITIEQLFDVVLNAGSEDFQSIDDIDRVDFRPGKRVHKVHSIHHYGELQIDAVTGQILSEKTRRSDLLEQMHDGSFFGGWMHDWLMPLVALGLLVLAASGLYLWLQPHLRKKTRKT